MENLIKSFREWICQCGTYVIFSDECPRCHKPKIKTK